MRWLIVVVLVLLYAPSARASCVAAVVVDGVVLYGGPELDAHPPVGEPRSAVAPACNDAGQNEPDGRTTVVPFEGVPPTVAVAGEGNLVYLAGGSLTALKAHPLHLPGRRFRRDRCGRPQPLAGAVTRSGFDYVYLRVDGRERLVRVDARTRMTNRPAYEPVVDGQGLRLTVRRCRKQLVADRIAFAGPTLEVPRYRRSSGGPSYDPPNVLNWIALGVILVVVGGVALERLTRPR